MLLRNSGEICVLDLNEIVTTVFNTLKKSHKNLTREDRQHLTDVMQTMFDDHITTQMYWTKRHVEFDASRYINMLGKLVDETPKSYMLIEDIQESFDILLAPVINLPTWRIIYIKSRGSNIRMELGEDYRVQDWMAKHAKEYRLSADTTSW